MIWARVAVPIGIDMVKYFMIYGFYNFWLKFEKSSRAKKLALDKVAEWGADVEKNLRLKNQKFLIKNTSSLTYNLGCTLLSTPCFDDGTIIF